MADVYLTPEQIGLLQSYGEGLLKEDLPRPTRDREIFGPLNAIAHAAKSFSGRQHLNLAEQHRQSNISRGHPVQPSDIAAVLAGDRSPQNRGSTTTTGSITPSSTETPFRTTARNPDGVELSQVRSRSGANFTVALSHAQRFQGLIDDLEAEGYEIDPAQSSGYNYRMQRGGNRLSQHAHGNAIDINSRLNAVGTRGNIDPALARRLAAKHGLRWLGDARRSDPMHFEVIENNAATPVSERAFTRAAGAVPGRRMNLGGPNSESFSTAPASPTAAADNAEQAVVAQVGERQPGAAQGARNDVPVGVPPKIEPNPSLPLLEQQVRNIGSIQPEQRQKIYEQYQAALQPIQKETAAGISYYHPRTGQHLYTMPKLQELPLSVGGMTIPQRGIMGPTGMDVIPSGPMGGQSNSGFGVPGGATASGDTNRTAYGIPRDMPATGRIGDLQQFAQEGDVARRLVEAQVGNVTNAIRIGEGAAPQIETLNNLVTSVQAGGRNITFGPGSDFAKKAAQFLANLGVGPQDRLAALPHTELVEKLNNTLAAQAVNAISSTGSNFQLQNMLSSNPGLLTSREGTLMLANVLLQHQKHLQEIGIMGTELEPNQARQWAAKVRDYYRSHPIILRPPVATLSDGTRVRNPRIATVGVETPNDVEELKRIGALKPGMYFYNPNGELLRVD